MKLLLVGDLHLRASTPRCRVEEDFTKVCMDKLGQIREIAKDADITLQAGDFFHVARPDNGLLAKTIKESSRMYAIFGQHDLPYHSLKAKNRSALAVLEAAGAVQLLGEEPKAMGYEVALFGASYGEEIPIPYPDGFNVLVTHRMVGDKEIYGGQEGFTTPEQLLDENPGYKLILVGDYHYPFTFEKNGRYVINAGCVFRTTTDNRVMEHQPKVVMVETDDHANKIEKVTDILLDVGSVDEVYKPDNKIVSEERASFLDMISKMKDKGSVGVSFMDNLLEYYAMNEISKEIRDIIGSVVYNKDEETDE